MTARSITPTILLLVTACSPAAPPVSSVPAALGSVAPAVSDAAATLRDAVGADELLVHLAALDAIAQQHDGTRAAGTPGYDASAGYVADALEAAGWSVERQRFTFPFFVDPATSTLAIAGVDATWTVERDFRPLIYSAAGDVTAEVAVVDGGCDPDDFAAVPDGAIAMATGGGCFRRQQAQNAQAAGAAALVAATDRPRDEVLRPTLLDPEGIEIPALSATGELARALAAAADEGRMVTLAIDVATEEREAVNVIGQAPGGDPDEVVMLGSHLDSVIDGPGINDNGSGSSLVLALAEAIADAPHRSTIRVGFWAGEELGILGSTQYVESLAADERERIAIYLNFDMVGSPNYVRSVYDEGDDGLAPEARQRFLDWFAFAGLAADPLDLGGGSDHGAFARAGIPTGGLFTGATERKTDEQAGRFGGEADALTDPCFHLPCDTLANVNPTALDEMADAAATVLAELAGISE